MWQIIAVLLAVALGVVLARHRLLKRELSRMAETMGEIHGSRTNRQLTVGSQQKELARLAVAVNTLYEDVDADKAAHRAAMDEMRQSMANISHDLRTPLTSILGYLKLLQKGDNSPEKAQSYLEVAYNKACALKQLVDGLFEMARLESGGYRFSHQRLDAVAVLGEELAGLYAQFEAAGKLPQVQLPNAPLWMVGDEEALGRVFANLLQNMAKHGEMPLAVSGENAHGEVVFHFSNAAPQLAPGDEERLFQRFFTADRTRTGRNTGLGLSIAKEFAEQMNGDIEAELKEGRLTFTLRWPATV